MVREKGLEPLRRKALVPKTNVSANFTTRAPYNKLLLEKYALIVNADHFKFAWPSKINKLKPGIYVVNAVIKNIEYHGLCLVSKFNENELDLNNILYLLDIETIPSKYDEIFIEFLGTIRYIEIQKDNKISNQDIDIAIGYFKTIQN